MRVFVSLFLLVFVGTLACSSTAEEPKDVLPFESVGGDQKTGSGYEAIQQKIAESVKSRLSTTPTKEAKKAIEDLDEQWDAAMNAGDYEIIAGFFTEDAIRMEADVPAQVGREAILTAVRSNMEENTIESKSVTEEIRLAGDWAVVWGTYEETARPKAGGEPVHTTGKWMEIHEKQADGSWKISRSIGNRDAPPPCE